MAHAPPMLFEYKSCTTLGADDGEGDAQKDRFKSDKEGENFKQKGHDGEDFGARAAAAPKKDPNLLREESAGPENRPLRRQKASRKGLPPRSTQLLIILRMLSSCTAN